MRNATVVGEALWMLKEGEEEGVDSVQRGQCSVLTKKCQESVFFPPTFHFYLFSFCAKSSLRLVSFRARWPSEAATTPS